MSLNLNYEIMVLKSRPPVDVRIHRLASTSPIDEFRQRLQHRWDVAMRQHTRWAAHRIAFVLSHQYSMGELHFISDALLNGQLRRYKVEHDLWGYGRKVALEHLKKAWA